MTQAMTRKSSTNKKHQTPKTATTSKAGGFREATCWRTVLSSTTSFHVRPGIFIVLNPSHDNIKMPIDSKNQATDKRSVAATGTGKQQQDILSCFRRQLLTSKVENKNASKRRKRDDESSPEGLPATTNKENKRRLCHLTDAHGATDSSDYDSENDAMPLASLLSIKPKQTAGSTLKSLQKNTKSKGVTKISIQGCPKTAVCAETAGATRNKMESKQKLMKQPLLSSSVGLKVRKLNAGQKKKSKGAVMSLKPSLQSGIPAKATTESDRPLPGASIEKAMVERSSSSALTATTVRCTKRKETVENISTSSATTACHESLDTALAFLQPKRKQQKIKKCSAKVPAKASSTRAPQQQQNARNTANQNDLTLQDIQTHFKKKQKQNIITKEKPQETEGTAGNQETLLDFIDTNNPQTDGTTIPEQRVVRESITKANEHEQGRLLTRPLNKRPPLGLHRSASIRATKSSDNLTQTGKEQRKTQGDLAEDDKSKSVNQDSTDDYAAIQEEEYHQEQHQRPRRSLNLIHQLVDRTVFGSRGRAPRHGPRLAQSTSPFQQAPRSLVAKPASWINLGTTSRENATTTSRIECMAWDPLGVLLAVAQSCNITKQSWIEIYDWDTVCAADRQGRSDRMRALAKKDKSRARLDIPPLLRFRVPSPSASSSGSRKTSWMRWNPHNPDQLAVASRCGSVLFCLNISHVEEALASAPSDHIMKPPRHSYWEFWPQPQGVLQSASSCVFVGKDHIVAAFGASLHCWRYYPKRDPTSIQPKLKWLYHFPIQRKSSLNQVSISSLQAIGKEHLVAGSTRGHLAVIQWKRVIATKATSSFSIATAVKVPSPTVVCQLLPHTSMDQQQIPSENIQDPSIMGVRHLRVDLDYLPAPAGKTSVSSSAEPKAPVETEYEQLCGRFSIQWITKCGWVMEVDLVASPSTSWEGYKVRRGKARALHRTPLVQTKLACGGIVTTRQKLEWSLPRESLASDASGRLMCWQNVPAVTRVLPHHDQRVLDDQPSLTRDELESNNFCLMLRGSAKTTLNSLPLGPNDGAPVGTPSIHSLVLPKRRGRPKLISVDPLNQEWAIVATASEQLYIVSLRSQP